MHGAPRRRSDAATHNFLRIVCYAPMRLPLADTIAKRVAEVAGAAIVAAIVASCATVKPTAPPSAVSPSTPPSSSRYYSDDGPPEALPPGIDDA